MPSTIYELGFQEPALKEWRTLDSQMRDLFRKALLERLDNPCVLSVRLVGSKDRYKIKLCSFGCRLVYEVCDAEIIVVLVGVGRGGRSAV